MSDSAEARPRLSEGLVQVYTGNGKGKTTAALGVVLRASAHGLRTHIVYFLKGVPRWGAEEMAALERLPGVSLTRFGMPRFMLGPGGTDDDRAQAAAALAEAQRAVAGGDYDVVVLDEVNVAVAKGLLSAQDVLAVVAAKPKHVELILTGRGAPPELIQHADLVTEMVEIKHPYQRGVLARAGIDY